jgi:hypothetical protein
MEINIDSKIKHCIKLGDTNREEFATDLWKKNYIRRLVSDNNNILA